MTKIKNISTLRDHAIETLENLKKKTIDVVEAGVTAKLYESIMSSLKTELDYHKMLDQRPSIAFLNGADILEVEVNKKRLINKK